jgi:hypothetical protein
LAIAPAAQAHDNDAAECNGTATGLKINGDLTIPAGGACNLIDSTVRGDVKVRSDGYFEASNTTIRGDLKSRRAQTIYVWGGSTVKGNVVGDKTAQVFVFGSTIAGRIDVTRASQQVNVCGNTVQGDIEVEKSSRDILVGDPAAVDCPGNVVKRGDVEIEDNVTDIELVVSGNTLLRGDLEVLRNGGTSVKLVQGNTGGDDLICKGNATPFAASGNTGWDRQIGQCATP